MSGSYRVIESFSQSLEGLRSVCSQKINALTGTGRVTVGVEDGPKNSTKKRDSARNNSNCSSSKSFQLFCLMTKVFVGAAAVADAAATAAAVATLTMNLALRQKRRNTHTHTYREEEKKELKSCFVLRNGKLVSCCGSVDRA